MYFYDRKEAGELLAGILLQKYKHKKVVVYGIPRGGVITAQEVAKKLHAPLRIVISKKIGYPFNSEYAIAALSEHGHLVSNADELQRVNKEWLKNETTTLQNEMNQRRQRYEIHEEKSLEGIIVIVVDDGIATGLTMKAAIADIQDRHPYKTVVATPVIAESVFGDLKKEVNEVITLEISDEFLGGVSAYYQQFPQVSDSEVSMILRENFCDEHHCNKWV